YAYTSVAAENDDATLGFQPFGPAASDNSALLLGFDYNGAFPQVEVNLAISTLPDSSSLAAFQCGLSDSPGLCPATLVWEYWNGTTWRTLTLLKDQTRRFTRSGHLYLQPPSTGMQTTIITTEPKPLYWIRARVQRSQYERPPKLLAVRTNTVAVRQAETIVFEVLGGSTGRRDQVFGLANSPVLDGSLVLTIDQGNGNDQSNDGDVWTLVSDFFGSSATDQHYVLDRTTGDVRFGDGHNGSIPVANAANPDGNIVATQYRFGGGKKGNVGANAIKTLTTSITGIDDGLVANLLPAFGGRDEETLDEAKKRAPRSIRSRSRAVTAEDFEYLAMQAATIKRAKALPLYHPDFPGIKVPGVITVIVVPDGDGPAPVPSEGTLRTVCAYLDQRRLLTAELYVV